MAGGLYKVSANSGFGGERQYDMGDLKGPFQSGPDIRQEKFEFILTAGESVFRQRIPGAWGEVTSDCPNTSIYHEPRSGYFFLVTTGGFNDTAPSVSAVIQYWLDGLKGGGALLKDLNQRVTEKTSSTPEEVHAAFTLETDSDFQGRHHVFVIEMGKSQNWIMLRFSSMDPDSISKFDDLVLATRLMRSYS